MTGQSPSDSLYSTSPYSTGSNGSQEAYPSFYQIETPENINMEKTSFPSVGESSGCAPFNLNYNIPMDFYHNYSVPYATNSYEYNQCNYYGQGYSNQDQYMNQAYYEQYPSTAFSSTCYESSQETTAFEKQTPRKRMTAVHCHENSICSNCKTRETTLWRRNEDGGVECNACNLYFRKNQRKRPLSLSKNGIMKRKRRPRNYSPKNWTPY